MTNGDFFIIFFLGLTALIVIICLVAWTIATILDKTEEKKRKKLIRDYPELKLLLSEYMRLTNEHDQTQSDYNSLKKDIDEWETKNHYYPKDKKIDGHIEELKKGLWELGEIAKEQDLLAEKAHKELELFWATNFPNLKEDERIMWWYW